LLAIQTDDCSLSPSLIQTAGAPSFKSIAIQTVGKPSSSLINDCSSSSFQYLKEETSNCFSSKTNNCIDLPLPSITKKPSSASRRLLQPVYIQPVYIDLPLPSIINKSPVAPIHGDIAFHRRHFVATTVHSQRSEPSIVAIHIDLP
jgi:hypothetical protein